MSLATVDDFAAFTGITLSAAQRERAQALLDLATGVIQAHTGQTIELVSGDVAVLEGNWSSALILPELPVVSVTSISINGAATLTENVDYVFDGHRTVRRGAAETTSGVVGHPTLNWGGPTSRVTVTYTHGWDDIPADIKAVCLQAAARAFANPLQHVSEAPGSYAVTYNPTGVTLTGPEKQLLGRLKRRWMAEL